MITNSDYLKELQQRIAREETENLSQESQIELFQSLIDTDPSIAQLLPGGALVTLPGYIGREDVPDDEWAGEYSPTYLDLAARTIKQNGAEIEVDGRRAVVFNTDARNDYLTRPDNRGRVFVTGGIGEKFSYTMSLRNGRLTVVFQSLADKVIAGDELSFSVGLLDGAMPEPVTDELTLRVVESRRRSNSGNRRPRRDDEGEEVTEGRALPPTRWLTKDGRMIGDEETVQWPDDFTDQDGGKAEDFGETSVYYINYDNAHFRRFLNAERNEIDQKVVAQQYRMGMLVLMMGLEDAYSRMEPGVTKTSIEEIIDEIRRLTAQAAATVVMSIAKTLPTIVNPASVSDPDDD